MSKRKPKSKQPSELKRFTEYMISGGAYFWSGYGVFFVVDKLLHGSFFWAKSLSTLVGWTVNFILQRYWVFNNPSLAKHQTEVTTRYIGITLANFVIDFFLVWGLKELGITPYIGQFVSSGFFTVWNYVWYKYYVFPQKYPTRHLKPVHHSPHLTRVAHVPRGAK
jgi:putative flippase GtrA